MDAATAHAV